MANTAQERQTAMGLVDGIFASNGMPMFLASIFDTEDKKNEFKGWMGDLFSQWMKSQAQETTAKGLANRYAAAGIGPNGRAISPGRYFSQRQIDDILSPEDKATRLERIGFKGGFANGTWTYDYDTWKAAGGKRTPTKSFGPAERKPLAANDMIVGFQGKRIAAQDMPYSDPATGKADVSRDKNGTTVVLNPTSKNRIGVSRSQDGGVTYTFGDTNGNATRNRYWQDRADQIAAESHDLKKINEGLTAAGLTPIQAGRRAAAFGGTSMRERGWLDSIFNGGRVRASMKGGKTGRRG